MNAKDITLDDVTDLDYSMLPVDGGQICERSYATLADGDGGYLVLRTHDRSDDKTTYHVAELDMDADEDSRFEPWNGILPAHGEFEEIGVTIYTYHEQSGHSETLDFVEDMDEAVSAAKELCEGGSWGDEGASVSVFVTKTVDGKEIDRRDFTVEIEPDHDALISRAGGDPDCDHDWTAEGEGGCDENPGVWSTGGTSMTFSHHCRTCGLHRTEYHCGSQRNPGECDTFSYTQPDSWCAECQSEECECESD